MSIGRFLVFPFSDTKELQNYQAHMNIIAITDRLSCNDDPRKRCVANCEEQKLLGLFPIFSLNGNLPVHFLFDVKLPGAEIWPIRCADGVIRNFVDITAQRERNQRASLNLFDTVHWNEAIEQLAMASYKNTNSITTTGFTNGPLPSLFAQMSAVPFQCVPQVDVAFSHALQLQHRPEVSSLVRFLEYVAAMKNRNFHQNQEILIEYNIFGSFTTEERGEMLKAGFDSLLIGSFEKLDMKSLNALFQTSLWAYKHFFEPSLTLPENVDEQEDHESLSPISSTEFEANLARYSPVIPIEHQRADDLVLESNALMQASREVAAETTQATEQGQKRAQPSSSNEYPTKKSRISSSADLSSTSVAHESTSAVSANGVYFNSTSEESNEHPTSSDGKDAVPINIPGMLRIPRLPLA